MKKVFSVAVELNFRMAVVAETEEEAEDIALSSYGEEMSNVRPEVDFFVQEITACPSEFKGTLPYGSERDGERETWPVEKWLERPEVTSDG